MHYSYKTYRCTDTSHGNLLNYTFANATACTHSLEPSTTVLSPYLKLGCLSSRLFYHKLAAVYKAVPGHAKPPVSLHGQVCVHEVTVHYIADILHTS
jgi:hypothetical protein